MANREQLNEINKARAGDTTAQVSLAKRYLFGEAGLPRSEATALLWLERAARLGSLEACIVIGSYIPVEIVQHNANLDSLLLCYKQAFLAGIDAAGLTFAELVLMRPERKPDLRVEARTVLESLAEKNVAKAQWLLVSAFRTDQFDYNRQQAATASNQQADFLDGASDVTEKKLADWTTAAAVGGVPEAKLALAENAWAHHDYQAFLHWALPEAELILQQYSRKGSCTDYAPTETQASTGFRRALLYRCAVCLCNVSPKESGQAVRYLELAASEGDRLAQMAIGLWLARMDSQMVVVPVHPKRASFERAIGWLTSAGKQGLAEAWYALSKIYLKAEFVGRSLLEAERFLKCAAELGHSEAQLELGTREWRTRHKRIGSDVNATLWLQKATRQGNTEAEALLEKVAPRARESAWAMEILPLLTPQVKKADPFLAVRIELAALVGLSKLEALWLDIHAADQEYCLVVDVVQHARNTKRRLISLSTVEERRLIDKMKQLFHGIEGDENGPEGDYRHRLYRLDKLLGKN